MTSNRVVACDTVNGVTVSTVEMSAYPGTFETALFDDRGGKRALNPSVVVWNDARTERDAKRIHRDYVHTDTATLLMMIKDRY